MLRNNGAGDQEALYDQPEEIKSKLRISGPFTVETLQSYEPLSPEELAAQRESDEGLAAFEDLVFSFLQSSGVMTGDKRERAVFTRVDRLASPSLHAEGFYAGGQGSGAGGQEEKKAYLYLGPKFGTVSKQAVSDAIKEARRKGDADWLLILGFSFESNLQDMQLDQGSFQVSIVRMHDDLLQDGLMKKDKKHASFVTIGEPDIGVSEVGVSEAGKKEIQVEIRGLDIYDPIKDEVKSRAAHDIAYWMVDDDYDGTNFVVKQVFFSRGSNDEFAKWEKGRLEAEPLPPKPLPEPKTRFRFPGNTLAGKLERRTASKRDTQAWVAYEERQLEIEAFETIAPTFPARRAKAMRYPIWKRDRIREIQSLDPSAIRRGSVGSVSGYLAFVFIGNRVALESPRVGNALYFFHADWQELCKLPKGKLRKMMAEGDPRIERFCHMADRSLVEWLRDHLRRS